MSFDTAHPALAAALSAHGYTSPTPVQAAVLGPEVAGRDLLVSARTGSGKTVAFGICIAGDLIGAGTTLGYAGAPLALVVAPTRELALPVRRELAWLFEPAGAKVVSCVGGMDVRREARALSDGAHIVVGTPGRLCDHLDRGVLRLGNTKALVLDEADEMLDLGFRDELERLLQATPPTRRTLLFSATLPPGIQALADRYQKNALRIAATSADEPHADIEHRAVLVAPREREHAVVNLLRVVDPPTALVFCATRDGVGHLHASLVERGFSAVALSGELSQAERGRALQALRDRRARVLVATDVAARGLDLPSLELVIHADLPHDGQVLLHRSGRTGRAGRKGTSVLVVPVTRRRQAERLLHEARLTPRWSEPPTADAVRAKDQERIVEELDAFVAENLEDDETAAAAVLAKHPPEAIAAALVRLYRKGWPDPEELPETESIHNRMGPRPAARPALPVRPAPVRAAAVPASESEAPAYPPAAPDLAPSAAPPAAPSAPADDTGAVAADAPPAAADRAQPAPQPAPAAPKSFKVPTPERPPKRKPAFDDAPVAHPAPPAEAPAPRTPKRKPTFEAPPEPPTARAPRRREDFQHDSDERGGGQGVWFRMNVGRANNADPRWIVPLLCRRGHIEKSDIGSIRVLDNETRFEIAPHVAGRFTVAIRRPDPREPWVRIVPMDRW